MRRLINLTLITVAAYAFYAGSDPYGAAKLRDNLVRLIQVG